MYYLRVSVLLLPSCQLLLKHLCKRTKFPRPFFRENPELIRTAPITMNAPTITKRGSKPLIFMRTIVVASFDTWVIIYFTISGMLIKNQQHILDNNMIDTLDTGSVVFVPIMVPPSKRLSLHLDKI